MSTLGPPRADDPEFEQEGLWAGPREAAGVPPGDRKATSGAADDWPGLTRSLTSTARLPGPAGLYYADVPNRIMALVIDIIVLSISGFILAWALGGLVSQPGAIDASGGTLDLAAFMLVLALQAGLSLAYFAGLWRYGQATAGMRLLGLRLGHELDGDAITPRRALVRWLLLGLPALLCSLGVYVPNAIGLILAAVGAVWLLLLLYTIAQSPSKQGLHDRTAHTIVVRARRGTP